MITTITADQEQIEIQGSCSKPTTLQVYEYFPFEAAETVGERAPIHSASSQTTFTLSFPRFDGKRDRLYSQFVVRVDGGELLSGVRYVTELQDIAAYDYPYPQVDSIKGLQVRDVDDALTLGIRHSALNLNQANIMRLHPDDNTITYTMDGHEFYFDEDVLKAFDEDVKTLSDNGTIVNLILLNSKVWAKRTMDVDMESVLLHPDYDPEGRISAFNVVTEEGLRYYQAFIEFVAERYSRSDAQYGRVSGYIIGNEVDAQWIWCNAGEKTVEEYVREYAIAVRTTFYAARKKYSQARVYLSLTHHWTYPHTDNPKRTYRGRDVMDKFHQLGVEQGDFDWSVAYHPYPEDLFDAEFWKDEKAWDSPDSYLITFKNIHVLPQYMSQTPLQFNGQIRHIILSEQGFHSDETEASEQTHAAAYALAYWKLKQLPEIEAFIYHAHVDHREEFDLSLGIRRRDKSSDLANAPGEPKPTWFVMRDIDGPKYDDIIQDSRDFIGEDYWQ